MQITLLPPLLPTEGVTSVPTASLAFTPGMKVIATVLGTHADGGTLLSLFGRQVPVAAPLPYPPGTTLRLEVVDGGSTPLLRLVATEPPPAPSSGQAPSPDVIASNGPPVSAVTYGLAAAVLAAREGADVRAAARAVAEWIPSIVARGLITPAQGDALLRALGPIPIHVGVPGTPAAQHASEAVAHAIATRLAEGGLLLERRLGDMVRQARPDAEHLAARDLRTRLSVLADRLREGPADLAPLRERIDDLQRALLAEQARSAAHLAHDGVVDVRLPLQADAQAAEVRLRLRVEKDAPGADDEPEREPWRQVTLDLMLEGLGRVQVRLGLGGMHVRAEFLVDGPDAADRIEGRLPDLERALEGAGFAEVLSRVVIDPVRAGAPDDLPDLPPLHSIVDARA